MTMSKNTDKFAIGADEWVPFPPGLLAGSSLDFPTMVLPPPNTKIMVWDPTDDAVIVTCISFTDSDGEFCLLYADTFLQDVSNPAGPLDATHWRLMLKGPTT